MLSILGLVAIVVIAIQVYKSAASTERNPVAWTAIAVVIGIGVQLVLPTIVGFAIGFYLVATGTPPDQIQEYFGLWGVVGIAGLVLSIVGMVLIAKHVSKVKDEDNSRKAPPPPPTFVR
jgi:hypothetical protein